MSAVLPFTDGLSQSAVANGRMTGSSRQVDESIADSRLAGVFLCSLGVMVVLASIIFATGEGGVIPAAGAAMAPFALYMVDRQRWFSLSNFWGGLLGVVGLAAAVSEFFSGDIEARLLSGGHFMCYLTWIVLWQHKAWRQYWMLAGLSILQVAVGSLLTNSHWLGIGLLAYIIAALWTLSVFTMYRMEAVSTDPQARRLGAPKTPVWFSVETGTARPHTRISDANIRVTPRFIGIALIVIAASLALSAVAFLLVPRVWVGQFQIFDNSPLPGTRPTTGFTREVRLGDLGQILENSDPVMDVRFFDHVSGEKLSLSEVFERLGTSEPLFRGAILEVYDSGRWVAGSHDFDGVSRRPSLEPGLLRQEITLQPLGVDTVFACGDPIACIARQPADPLLVNLRTRTFSRDSNANLQLNLRYSAYSRPSDAVSANAPSQSQLPGRRQPTTLIPASLQELVDATREKLAQTPGLDTPTERALFLESWLRDSGEFSYTLSLSVSDPYVDPVHDFFFNRKTGHCEYFAATLTMMLRSAGIHARMVSGFKGGVVDTNADSLKVQQLHAHAWVEAWLDDRWQQLDPTPASRLASVQEFEAGSAWSNLMSRIRNLWSDGLTWSKEDQETLIYQPVTAGITEIWQTVNSPATGLRNIIASARDFLSDPSRWFSWQGGLAVIVISLIAIGIWKFTSLVWRLIQRQRQLSSIAGAAGASVPFYARMESLLERLSLIRAPAQTPLEFAGQAQGRFQSMTDAAQWPLELPADVAQSFYAIRFGGEPLSDELARRLNTELDRLEERIRHREAETRSPR